MSLFSKLKKFNGTKTETNKIDTSKFINDPTKLYFGILLAVDKIDYTYSSISGISRPVLLGEPVDFNSVYRTIFSCYKKTENNTYINIFNNIEVDYADINHIPQKCQEQFHVKNYDLTMAWRTPTYHKVGLLEPKQLTYEQIQKAAKAGANFSNEDIRTICSYNGDLDAGINKLVKIYSQINQYEK